MSRKTVFPKVMCTQHPDSASKYIATQEEPEEAVEAVRKVGYAAKKGKLQTFRTD